MRRFGIALAALAGIGLVWVLGQGTFGTAVDAGKVQAPAVSAQRVEERDRRQRAAEEDLGAAPSKQILFGDLHVHSTYSLDAFTLSLPMTGGEGAHPVADACDFARHCAGLDFWSINDHAVTLTTPRWNATVEALRECQARTGEETPDLVTFAGWEWTQMGTRPGNHYGHKNVIFRDLDDGSIPTRPIYATPPAEAEGRNFANLPGPWTLGLLALAQGQQGRDLARFMSELGEPQPCPDGPVRELPADCREGAATPGELFAKLDDWDLPALVIPHGTSWGMYTPPGSSWWKQATPAEHDPRWQKLIEVYSGHGNSEEFRDWSAVAAAVDGASVCPPPRPDYLPSCWQAGEIIRERCLADGTDEALCAERAAVARGRYVEAGVSGHLTVPGARVEEWLDAGQCRDCFQPAFNHRPKSSVQFITALGGFHEGSEEPLRLRFGFLASSDVHSARPGTGYKEVDRVEMTDARLSGVVSTILGGIDSRDPVPQSAVYDPATTDIAVAGRNETERSASFFTTGGLVAVHATGRDRRSVWSALDRREVYGTSGPHILLWFDLLNAPDAQAVPMGSEVMLDRAPAFEVKAMGSFVQRPGCSDEAEAALGPERLARLCRGECLHPSDERRRISRIEVVRIRPQQSPDEPISELIDDPWQVFPCRDDAQGCRAVFTDPDFVSAARETVYYVRAIEEPTPAINADNLRCSRDETGACLEVNPCPPEPSEEQCLGRTEQRAWSSPIFVDPAPQM